MLSRRHRLTDEFRFRAVKKRGKVVHTEYFVFSYLNNASKEVKVGFIASSKVGGAVDRNRATRLLRESIAPVISEIKSGSDIVIIAKKNILAVKTQVVLPIMKRVLDDAGLYKCARIQDETDI